MNSTKINKQTKIRPFPKYIWKINQSVDPDFSEK